MWVAGSAADGLSTEAALAKGGRELNPLQPESRAGRLGAQAAVAGVGCVGDSFLRKRGKKGLAKALRVAFFCLKLGVTVHNIHQIRKSR